MPFQSLRLFEAIKGAVVLADAMEDPNPHVRLWAAHAALTIGIRAIDLKELRPAHRAPRRRLYLLGQTQGSSVTQALRSLERKLVQERTDIAVYDCVA